MPQNRWWPLGFVAPPRDAIRNFIIERFSGRGDHVAIYNGVTQCFEEIAAQKRRGIASLKGDFSTTWRRRGRRSPWGAESTKQLTLGGCIGRGYTSRCALCVA